MCYEHHLLKFRFTSFYHKIGDPLLNDKKELPNEKILMSYKDEEIKEIIYDLWDKIYNWRKCLYSRKVIEKLYPYEDYGHKIFVENVIIKNIKELEDYLSKLYTFIIKKEDIITFKSNILLEENTEKNCFYKNIKGSHSANHKNKKKNKYRKINNKVNKEMLINLKYLDTIPEIKKFNLNDIKKYNEIIYEIYDKNEIINKFFTSKVENNNILILNNASYCVFIKNIFNKYKTDYITLNYFVKNKKIKLTSNYLLTEDIIHEEMTKIQKFNDDLKLWIKRILKIIVDTKKNSYLLYKTFIKHKVNNLKKECDCHECEEKECYFQDIDNFIQTYYNILCIHINKGIIEKICLEKRHTRIYKKKLLEIEDILQEIEIINKSLLIPNTLDECLCFWILNLINDENINVISLKGWINCCIDNNIFYICKCFKLFDLNEIEILKKILIIGCNIYIIKNNLNINMSLSDYIFENFKIKKNNSIEVYFNNKTFNIKYKNEHNDIILHYDKN